MSSETKHKDIRSYTYSEYFDPIPDEPDIISDIGWGCVHRSAQMLFHRALYRVLGVRASRLFEDGEDNMFSIQSLLKCSIHWGMDIKDKWSPGLACQAFKNIGDKNKHAIKNLNFLNYTNGISKEELLTIKLPAIVTVPVRLGCNKTIDTRFMDCFSIYMNLSMCAGIIGGKGNSGFFFYKIKRKTKLKYMDPHIIKEKESDTYPIKKNTIKFENIDPCMAFCFVLLTEDDRRELTQTIEIQDFMNSNTNFICWNVKRKTVSVQLDESSDWECLI